MRRSEDHTIEVIKFDDCDIGEATDHTSLWGGDPDLTVGGGGPDLTGGVQTSLCGGPDLTVT